MTRREKAIENFYKGYNCSQSVVLAFKDLLPLDERMLCMLASSFGGGMARLREVCGCVSGMSIVAGLLYGYDGPDTGEAKNAHYRRIQELAREFEALNGSIVCRELLGACRAGTGAGSRVGADSGNASGPGHASGLDSGDGTDSCAAAGSAANSGSGNASDSGSFSGSAPARIGIDENLQKHDAPEASARTAEYYRKRPCPELCGQAAEILERYIDRHTPG